MYRYKMPVLRYGGMILAVSILFTLMAFVFGVVFNILFEGESDVILGVNIVCTVIGILGVLGLIQAAVIFVRTITPEITITDEELTYMMPSGFRNKVHSFRISEIISFKKTTDGQMREYVIEERSGKTHSLPLVLGMPITEIAGVLKDKGIIVEV